MKLNKTNQYVIHFCLVTLNLLLLFSFDFYFLQPKIHNNLFLGISYAFLVLVFRSIQADKPMKNPFLLFLVFLTLVSLPLTILYFIDPSFLSYSLFGWIVVLSIFSAIKNAKLWTVLLAAILSVAICNFSTAIVPSILFVSILVLTGIEIFSIKKVALLLYVPLAVFSGWQFFDVTFFHDQLIYKDQIIKQVKINGLEYTITKQKEWKSLYENGSFIFSTADYHMYYESLVHSAMQIVPGAKHLLVATKDEIFINHELKKYNGLEITFLGNHSYGSELISEITQYELPVSDENMSQGQFDIIFLDESADVNNFFDLISPEGIIVIKGKHQAIKPYFSKKYHIALPTLGEIEWTIMAVNVASFERVTDLPKKIETKWYTNEAYHLISNSGKF